MSKDDTVRTLKLANETSTLNSKISEEGGMGLTEQPTHELPSDKVGEKFITLMSSAAKEIYPILIGATLEKAITVLEEEIEELKVNNEYLFDSLDQVYYLSEITDKEFEKPKILISIIYYKLFKDQLVYCKLSKDCNVYIQLAEQAAKFIKESPRSNITFEFGNSLMKFLNYVSDIFFNAFYLTQKSTITALIVNVPYEVFSENYIKYVIEKNFKELKSPMSIQSFKDIFEKTSSIQEQFHLLKVFEFYNIKVKESKTSEDAFELGEFYLKFLYSNSYKITYNEDDLKSENVSNISLLIDACQNCNDNDLQNISLNNIGHTFIQDKIFYLEEEIQNLQLLKNKKEEYLILELVLSYIQSSIVLFQNDMKIQCLIYFLLRQIYFKAAFLETKKNVIIDFIKQNNAILTRLDPNKKSKISLESNELFNFFQSNQSTDKCEIKNEKLPLSNFNFNLGYPGQIKVLSGEPYCYYVDVTSNNSLVFICFKVDYKDVGYIVEKFEPTLQKFRTIFSIEKVLCEHNYYKTLLFAQEKGLYKITYNNNYSWYNHKMVQHQILVLNTNDNIDLNKETITKEMYEKSNASNEKKIFFFFNNKNYTFFVNKIQNYLLTCFPTDKQDIHEDQKEAEEKKEDKKEEETKEEEEISTTKKKNEDAKNYIIDTQETVHLNFLISQNNLRIIKIGDNNSKVIQYEERIDENILTKDGQNEKAYRITQEFFENLVYEILQSINPEFTTEKGKSKIKLNISCFSLNTNLHAKNKAVGKLLKSISQNTLNFTVNHDISNSIKKIGLYPSSLVSLYPSLQYNCFNLAEQCLIYHLYLEQLKSNLDIKNTICLMHFDNLQNQTALFVDGGITKGFQEIKFEKEKPLKTYIKDIIKFIEIFNESLDNVELIFSYTNKDESEMNEFYSEMKLAVKDNDPPIDIVGYGKDFIYEVFKFSYAFFDKENYEIFKREE